MRYQLRLSMKCTFPLLIVALVFARSSIGFADESLFKREKETVYGRKHGLAMTLDIFQPLAKRNNRGIVFVVSGGWFSAQNQIDGMAKRLNWVALIKRGYTLFPVVNRDADKLVPIQQAHRIMPKFKAAGVEARLIVMPGNDHGWVAEPAEVKMVGEWFDKHLLESR
jgi:hypothetical protein